nr:hypothetical protein [Brevundimonas sp. P7753]
MTFAYLRWDKIVLLDPNSAGDFLAGAFAPLAFLWLVLGFFQQGIELRNSGEALWLQGEELRNSVEQQRELVSAARDQLEFDRTVIAQRNEEAVRTAQPSFKLVYEGMVERRNGSALQSFRLINTGKDCFDLNFAISGGPDDPTSDYNDDVVKNGTWARIQIWIANDFDGELLARVMHVDVGGELFDAVHSGGSRRLAQLAIRKVGGDDGLNGLGPPDLVVAPTIDLVSAGHVCERVEAGGDLFKTPDVKLVHDVQDGVRCDFAQAFFGDDLIHADG